MKTTELEGALLDYHTARAEGVPAAELDIRDVQRSGPRTPEAICVRKMTYRNGEPCALMRLDYSTNWALCGPLVEKHGLDVRRHNGAWYCLSDRLEPDGDTAMIAICRAVVRAAFGDEVEDLKCT